MHENTATETPVETAEQPRRRRFRLPDLSIQVLIALILGVLAGIFFGEPMTVLKPVGDVFIALLQMAVWPYIVVSLIGGLGRLSSTQAASLGLRGGVFFLLFWGIGLLAVLAIAATFPTWTSAAFFSTSLAETAEGLDFVGLYIPSNPFASLADSVLPAVVLFCVALGVALIAIEEDKKRPILSLLDTLTDALLSIASAIVRLAPIGVFALVGVAAGTMRVEELVRLQVYIYSYIAIALLLSLWVLPGLVTVLLPISYRQLIRPVRGALITAFATGSLLVVLPLIAEGVKEALREIGGQDRDAESAVDVVVPVNFTLPNLGKLIALAFVPFAGWYTGFEMAAGQYPLFLLSGLFSMFAEVIALPFLLDLMRIPADMFQLFVVVDVSTGRFGQLLGGVHTVALAMLIGGLAAGLVKVRWAALGRYAAITVALTLAVVAGLRAFYEYVLPHEYEQDESLMNMRPAVDALPFTVLDALPPADSTQVSREPDEIVERGVLRVGFLPESLPFAFTNADGSLVGLDVDLASELGRDMGVDLEFVEVARDSIAEDLVAGRYDLVMSGLTITPERNISLRFSTPYMETTMGFVVRDHRRAQFSSRDAVTALKNPRIGVLADEPYYVNTLRAYLPQVEIVSLDSIGEFFTLRSDELDALFTTAERGSAWTLIYPEFSVAIPQPDVRSLPVAIVMHPDAEPLSDFIDAWLRLKREDKTVERLYRYWILGAGAEPRQPRWSVIRNVFGWVD